MHYASRVSAGFAILWSLASPATAEAGPPETPVPKTAADRAALAEALFAQGKRLMIEGRFSEACARFRESERIDHGIGTLLNLADCYEQNGQTASAWAEFRSAAAAAHAAGQAEREQVARDRAHRLLPLLARLTILIPQRHVVPGLVVMRDDIVLDKSHWNATTLVDPGAHSLVVSAPGKRTDKRIITVPKWSGAWVTTTVPALADLPPRAPPAPAKATLEPGMSSQQITGLSIGSVGIAGVLIGSALGLHSISRNNAAAPHCRGALCDPEGVALQSQAQRAGSAATVALIVSGAALAAGATVYFTAPKRSQIGASAGIGVTPSSSALFLEAAW
jgi:hypothetical protein